MFWDRSSSLCLQDKIDEKRRRRSGNSLLTSFGVIGRAVPLLGGEKAGCDHAPHAVGEMNRRCVHLDFRQAWSMLFFFPMMTAVWYARYQSTNQPINQPTNINAFELELKLLSFGIEAHGGHRCVSKKKSWRRMRGSRSDGNGNCSSDIKNERRVGRGHAHGRQAQTAHDTQARSDNVARPVSKLVKEAETQRKTSLLPALSLSPTYVLLPNTRPALAASLRGTNGTPLAPTIAVVLRRYRTCIN